MEYEVEPLTTEEEKWIKKLEKLLLACPSDRIHLFTIGDRYLTVIDGNIMDEYCLDIHDGYAETYGLVLANICSKPLIHATTG